MASSLAGLTGIARAGADAFFQERIEVFRLVSNSPAETDELQFMDAANPPLFEGGHGKTEVGGSLAGSQEISG
jgi:hypothetical protein